MRAQQFFCFLLSTLFNLTSALDLPLSGSIDPSLNLTQPSLTNTSIVSTNVTILGSEFTCRKGKRLSRKHPRFADCGGAIRQLSDNHKPGTFHIKGLMNNFRLPVEKKHKTCAVLVEMNNGRLEDEGTWLSISLAATQLNIVCVSTSAFPTNQGGYTTAGLHDGVRVKLMYTDPGEDLAVGNGTVVGDQTSDS